MFVGGEDVRLDTKMKIDSVCVGGGGGDVRLDTKMKIDSGGGGGMGGLRDHVPG